MLYGPQDLAARGGDAAARALAETADAAEIASLSETRRARLSRQRPGSETVVFVSSLVFPEWLVNVHLRACASAAAPLVERSESTVDLRGENLHGHDSRVEKLLGPVWRNSAPQQRV